MWTQDRVHFLRAIEHAFLDFGGVPEVVRLGPPGAGKSHIAISLAVAAIQSGYTVLYISAFDLAQEMSEAEATGTRRELVNQLMRTDLLVLEDLGVAVPRISTIRVDFS